MIVGAISAATSAQLVALVMIAMSSGGATSQRLGDFYDMDACRSAASRASLIGAGEDVHLSFACVPMTPVSSSSLLPPRHCAWRRPSSGGAARPARRRR